MSILTKIIVVTLNKDINAFKLKVFIMSRTYEAAIYILKYD